MHWNTHLTLKSKIKLCLTKNKNHHIMTKRIEYDLPPKFISKIDFSFKIDESVISQEEAQALYNQMRNVTKNHRAETMTLYEQAMACEKELLTNEIKQTIENLPQTNNDEEISFASFKQYHELQEERLNLEIEKSLYFLSEQRFNGENNNLQKEEQDIIIASILIRLLGEDFLLQP